MSEDNTTSKCYTCVHRGTVPGSCHSSCKWAYKHDVSAGDAKGRLHIEYDERGWVGGWFNWPYDFDPVWLDRCDGFEPKTKTEVPV